MFSDLGSQLKMIRDRAEKAVQPDKQVPQVSKLFEFLKHDQFVICHSSGCPRFNVLCEKLH